MDTAKSDPAQLSAEEKRAQQLMVEAEKTLNKFNWFGLAGGSRTEDAITLYQKAANNFKIAQKWELAGEAFCKCADLDVKMGNAFEASGHYVDAADMFKRVDPPKAITYYAHGISIMCENGRFGAAAKHSESIADLYEKENNISDALKFYQQAANYYNSDNSPARANKNLEKVACHAATLGDYKQSSQIFEELGKSSLESNLLKFNAKKHFLHAGMCYLARGDYVAAKNAIDKFGQLDYTFSDSREGKLLATLVECCENYETDKFSEELYAYDSISKLNPWETSILLRVKNSLQEEGEEVPDLQ